MPHSDVCLSDAEYDRIAAKSNLNESLNPDMDNWKDLPRSKPEPSVAQLMEIADRDRLNQILNPKPPVFLRWFFRNRAGWLAMPHWVPEDCRRPLADLAREHGISLPSAVCLLLRKGLNL